MSAAKLRAALEQPGIIVAPGVYDHMSLLLAKQAGFSACYASGYWGAASALGEPDVGIAGRTDFVNIFGGFAAKTDLSIIADADTGFGSISNLAAAARDYARVGIAAMQIEDQTFPKICGHVGRAVSAPAEEMEDRVKVAAEARGDSGMLIIARTDARRTEGMDAAIDRLKRYADAGADVLFLEAMESEAEIERAAQELPLPLMLNAAHGGFTPILSPSAYEALGCKMAIFPAGAPLSAARAAADFYAALKADDANGTEIFDFQEMTRLLGMNDIVALQERIGRA